MPSSYLHALELGKRIDRELDTEGQLWLIEYLQQYYWQKTHKPQIIQELEKDPKKLVVLRSTKTGLGMYLFSNFGTIDISWSVLWIYLSKATKTILYQTKQ